MWHLWSEVAIFVLHDLPIHLQKNLIEVEWNQHMSRHGKDHCDATGSTISRWLGELERSGELTDNIDKTIEYLEDRVKADNVARRKAKLKMKEINQVERDIVFLHWNPPDSKPQNFKVLDIENAKISHCKKFIRQAQDSDKYIILQPYAAQTENTTRFFAERFGFQYRTAADCGFPDTEGGKQIELIDSNGQLKVDDRIRKDKKVKKSDPVQSDSECTPPPCYNTRQFWEGVCPGRNKRAGLEEATRGAGQS